MWHPNDIEIERIPNTRDAHFFESIKPYEIRYAVHSLVNNEQMDCFSFIGSNEVLVQPKGGNDKDFAIGSWVKVKYLPEDFYGLVINKIAGEYKIQCLKKSDSSSFSYKLEPDHDTVWYTKDNILSQMKDVTILINSRGMHKIV